MGVTSIQWTDSTWNPIRARNKKTGKIGHYCEMVSPGCANCYASAFPPRFGLPFYVGQSVREQRHEDLEPFLDEEVLRQPLRWKKPRRIFVCSMTDLFGEWVPDEWIVRCLAIMALTRWHTYQLLTKRPERGRRVLLAPNADDAVDHMAFDLSHELMRGDLYDGAPDDWPLPNIWLGVSVEDKQRLDERSMILSATPAAVRFWSVEPLLEDLGNIRGYLEQNVDWVIIGGESGHGARPFNVAWARSIIAQCKEKKVAVFLKQLGACVSMPNDSFSEWPRDGDGLSYDAGQAGCHQGDLVTVCLIDRKGGDMHEWPEDLRVREFPSVK